MEQKLPLSVSKDLGVSPVERRTHALTEKDLPPIFKKGLTPSKKKKKGDSELGRID